MNNKKFNFALLIFLPLSLLLGSSCNKYLNVVPDNVSTIDDAFTLRNEAEKFLFTCYAYLPRDGDIWYNPGLETADELWITLASQIHWQSAFRIALGQQNVSNPYFNEWRGTNKGVDGSGNTTSRTIWQGIRNCNIFLENMRDTTKVRDISSVERAQWIGEGLFLKAYFHYYMLRMYGPIPIISENVPVDGDIQSNYLIRRPVDECVDSIASWLDEARQLLPPIVSNENKELGRITRPIALAVKAKLLVMAASPLFNGNTDFSGLKDKEGNMLFNTTYDPEKWVKAQKAAQEAIESAEQANFSLYYYENDRFNLSDTTKIQLNIRNAVTEAFNQETVWGNSNSYFVNQPACIPPLVGNQNQDRGQFQGFLSPPIKIAKLFYTSHGVPIEEDKVFDFNNYNQLRTADDSEKFYIKSGYTTARLNFDREPRFYADLGFDGAIWYMKDGNLTGSDQNTFHVEARHDQVATSNTFNNWSATGYFVKKLVNWESTTNSSQAPAWKQYPWPEIRLADLYLLFAEAENEVNGGSSLAIQYLDKVRERAGLKGVVESWTKYSNNPVKYSTKEGLRAIIHRERTIELMFEGQRFWDLRRWKEAPEVLNQNITGWNLEGSAPADYYQETYIYGQKFISPRDYFWPIGNYDTRRNPKLVENLGW